MVLRYNQSNMAGSLSTLELKTLLLKGGLSMSVPMTAAAVLRLSLPLKPGQTKLSEDFKLEPYIWIALFLGLIESTKQWIVYQAPQFFQWDALHLIALSLVLLVWFMQNSIAWVWVFGLAATFGAPALISALVPIENSFEKSVPPHSLPTMNWIFIAAFICLGFVISIPLLRSRHFSRKHKTRILGIGAIAWAVVCCLLYRIPDIGMTTVVFRELPFGILMGSSSGLHIWGLLPWGGLMALGFLIYDLMLRFQSSSRFLLTTAAGGLFSLLIFFYFFSDQTLASCSAQLSSSSFNGMCFNRTPTQIFLALGLFMLLAPVSVVIEKAGLENKYVQAFSRSILWVYVYETSVLYFLSEKWAQIVPKAYAFQSFILFSVATSFALAMIVDRFKPRLKLTLQRRDTYE